MENRQFMLKAVAISEANVKNGLGGPFGAVIVKDGKIISESANMVTKTNDPTAHAEVSAIRIACKELDTFDLSGCEIYTSCEPCPMCLGAIYWARIGRIYYGNTKSDAAKIGFDDKFIYDEIDKPVSNRSLPTLHVTGVGAENAFELWRKSLSKIEY